MRNDRGFAVPLALLVIVALGLVGAAAAWMSAGDRNIANLYATSNEAADAAGAGVEHAIAEYEERLLAYDEDTDGDLDAYLEDGDWPLVADVNGFDYTVDFLRDSFDFDDDGDEEPVSCNPDGDLGGGGGGGGDEDEEEDEETDGDGNGDGDTDDIGDSPGGDDGDYWEQPNGGDKDGDGQTGLAGGHFDPDVFTDGNHREYHQHEFDDKYDTTRVEIREDPHLLWDEIMDDAAVTGNVTITWDNILAADGWYRVTLKNGTVYEALNEDAVSITVNPNQIESFRIQFTDLTNFACTNPGAVKSDAVDRDGAFGFRMNDDTTGDLLYEFAVYWHNNSDDCVPDDDGDTETPDKGDTKNATDDNTDQNKADKYCEEWEDKWEDYEKEFEKAEELKDEAEALDDAGEDSTKKWKKYYEQLEKAEKKYAEAVVLCDKAHDHGTCDCTTVPLETEDEEEYEDEEEEENAGGGLCELNGDDLGTPVYILRSTATRDAFSATQRLRVTSNDALSKVWRLAWLAD